MKQLQDYLNEDGKELEHDTELQPFYALPFIEDFYADTFLANILEQSWLDKLTDKINSFIRNHRQVRKSDKITQILFSVSLYLRIYFIKIINIMKFIDTIYR